jgi:hypothetical protein
VPALRAASVESAEVLDAVLAARARLGAPADKAELRRYLEAKDPAVQAAAIRALAALPSPAVSDLGRYATSDKAVKVRVAAIEALGATKQAGGDSHAVTDVRRANTRGPPGVGPRVARDRRPSRERCVREPRAPRRRRRHAEVRGRSAARVDGEGLARGAAAHGVEPGGEVRAIVEHGLQWQHSHQHVAE